MPALGGFPIVNILAILSKGTAPLDLNTTWIVLPLGTLNSGTRLPLSEVAKRVLENVPLL